MLLIIHIEICSDGAVRTAGGSTSLAGIVEICVNTRWGRVCEDSWNDTVASVVCRQLGYQSGTYYIAITFAHFSNRYTCRHSCRSRRFFSTGQVNPFE